MCRSSFFDSKMMEHGVCARIVTLLTKSYFAIDFLFLAWMISWTKLEQQGYFTKSILKADIIKFESVQEMNGRKILKCEKVSSSG